MTVMIKSWTGEMVPARVGMVVSHPILDMSLLKITRISDTPFCIWVSYIDDTSMEYHVKLDDLTMISCPLADGDRIEIFVDDVWFYRDMFGDIILYKPTINYKFPIRHANPNLRTKPEGNV